MRTLQYGSRTVNYRVRRNGRQRLQISVFPDGKVEVVAPTKAKSEEIEARVKRRLRWIAKQQRAFEAYYPKPSPRKYVSGESWLYQGRQYRLKVVKAAVRPKVALRRPLLVVEAQRPKDRAEVKKLLDAWYRKRAQERLGARYEECSKRAAKYGISAPEMRLQKMTRRWGSYSPQGRILLNPELVKAPVDCLDYVILHELAHAKFPHHDPQFYRLLIRLAPAWPRVKARLEHLLV